MLEIRLLGRFAVTHEGKRVGIDSRPAKRLLAYLAINRGTVHPREKLSGLLWPESSEKNARKNLRQALWQLRSAIGDAHLLVEPGSIALHTTSDLWLDVAALEDPSSEDLESRLALYEGELLPGFYEDWIQLERDRMAATHARVMQQHLGQLVREERWSDVLRWAELWIAKGHVPEPAYRMLMRAHAALGDRSQVEAVYQRCSAALQDDLGVDPSDETVELYRALLDGEMGGRVPDPFFRREDDAVAHGPVRLPAERTPFVGREKEVEEITALLKETRLLTITGPGGMGKTRLALKAAEITAGSYVDGCFFVPLARIGAVENFVQTIAEAVQFPTATHEDPQRQLLRYLQDRQLLLLMDNFEHLIEAAPIVSEILQAAPEVRVLVTSREKLNLQSETAYTLGGMGFQDQVTAVDLDKQDAVALFLQSARKVHPEFTPSADDLDHILAICQIVGGMPLAIELAAAWLHILRVEDILHELEHGLDILVTEMRDAPQRHHSIRAVLDHSWSLLSTPEQEIFPALSVFTGGFTLAAARQVTGASLPLLAGLVSKSFLSHDPSTGRLEMHEVLRQYAQEQLEGLPEACRVVHETHADYYASFMRQQWDALRGHQQLQALADIDLDIENVRTAWRHSLERKNTAQIWKLVHGLRHVYWIRWWNLAGMELFKDAVRAFQGQESEEALRVRALAMAFQAWFMAWLDQAQGGYDLAHESVEILMKDDHSLEMVLAYYSLTVNSYMLGLYDKFTDAIKRMVQIVEGMGDRWLMAFTMFATCMLSMIEEDYTEAGRLAERALELYEELGDTIGSTMPMIVLGHTALAEGDYARAREWYQRCLWLAQEVGFFYSIQTSSKYLTKVALSQDDCVEGERYLLLSLAITKDIGFVRDLLNLLFECARLRVAQNRIEDAVELLTMVREHPESHHIRWFEGRIRDSSNDLLASLEVELPHESFVKAQARGRTLVLDHVVAGLLEGAPD